MSEQKNPIIIIDASSYLFRSYHIINMRTKDGRKSNAIYGTINLIHAIVTKFNPHYVAVVFDPPGGSFRNEIFPEYKANRATIDDELKDQIKPTQDIISAMGYKTFVVSGYEADDVIGSISKQLGKSEHPVYIVSGDKDFVQLVNNNVFIYDECRKASITPENAHLRLGVPYQYTIDFLSICGDSADNIPGAKGIGEKTAQALINNLGGIKEIYSDLNKVLSIEGLRGAKGVVTKLIDSKEKVELSYKLATIKTDIDLMVTLEDLKPQPINIDYAVELMEQWDLRSKIEQLRSGKIGFKIRTTKPDLNLNSNDDETISKSGPDELQVTSRSQPIPGFYGYDHYLNEFKGSKLFLYPDYLGDKLVNVGFRKSKNSLTNDYLATAHIANEVLFTSEDQSNSQELYQFISELILSPNIELITFDIKRLAHSVNLDHNLIDVDSNINSNDVQLLSYAANSHAGQQQLDKLTKSILNLLIPTFGVPSTDAAKVKFYDTNPITEIAKFMSGNIQALELIWNELQNDQNAINYYNKIEKDLWIVLYTMERKGINVDISLLDQLSNEFSEKIQNAEKQVHESVGKEFNLNSPKQVAEIIFNQLNLGTPQQQKKGSTSVEVLETISHPVAALILEYRTVSKLKSTYTDALMKEAHNGNLIHTNYEQKAVTGRLTSNNPNLQNIPIRSEQGRKIRQAFIPRPNQKLYAIDYSQIELRVVASISNEKNMIDSFDKGIDIHLTTAADIFNIPLDQVTSEKRRFAKSINFGLIYGMGAHGLAQSLNISRTEAQKYINNYFAKFPNVKTFMDNTISDAKDKGYVSTLNGRKIYLPTVNKGNHRDANAIDRFAINAPIQGTAAEIIKLAMIQIDRLIRNQDGIEMLLQVHDELVFSVEQGKEDMINKIIEIMEQTTQMAVKLKVEMNSGKNWDEAH